MVIGNDCVNWIEKQHEKKLNLNMNLRDLLCMAENILKIRRMWEAKTEIETQGNNKQMNTQVEISVWTTDDRIFNKSFFKIGIRVNFIILLISMV